jgi:mannose-1-phosphate guanylyltransferase/mannose-6-phosphate isomerase
VLPLILSGGAGKRLWPLSRQTYPKQFLKVLDDTSPFQQTCLRLIGRLFAAPIVIANEQHRFLVAEQLRERNLRAQAIVLEPVARNTTAAALAGVLLAAQVDPERLLLLVPSDHDIADAEAFQSAIAAGVPAACDGQFVTFGVMPDRPHTGYGYIEVGSGHEAAKPVARFIEKPHREAAKDYLESGRFLWNAGIFLFSARTMIEAAERHCPETLVATREALRNAQSDLDFIRLADEAFREAQSISLDYAIIEKVKNVCCVALGTGWNDLGSWSEIWRSAEKDKDGNAKRGDVRYLKSRNCFTYTDQATVSVVGIEDAIVVATRDAVLVTSKAEAQSVKDIVEALEREGRDEAIVHQRVHRPWGWYERLALGSRYQVKCIMVNPGARLSLQSHFHRSEHWVVVSGTVEVTVGDTVKLVAENQSTYVPINAVHRLANPGKVPAFLIEVQSGAYFGEDDIIRIEDEYGRAT